MDDWELVQTYAKNRSDAAFAELVHRHLNWVYSAALRQVGDPHLAQDVAQAVFVLLAHKASRLRRGTILNGWLFRTTRFVAAHAVRSEQRRRVREATASAMSTINSPGENELLWNQLTPHLDRAVAALSQTDRSAILLRFYEQKSLREVGQQLGLSEDAAKKRVTRAIEKMRKALTRRGVVLGGAGLIAVLAEQTVQAAPANLAIGMVKAVTATASASATLPHLVRETLQAWRLAKVKLVAGIAAATVSLAALAVSMNPGRGSASTLSSVANQSLAATAPGVAATRQPTNAEAASTGLSSDRTINIHVVQAQMNTPIAGATITVWEGEQKTTGPTDEQGRYQLQLPETDPRHLRVRARKEGYVPMQVSWDARRETFRLPREFTFALEPGVPIGGSVQDEQGQPISGVSVSVATIRQQPQDMRVEEIAGVDQDLSPSVNETVATDAQGRWRCESVPASLNCVELLLAHPDYVSDLHWEAPVEPDKLQAMTSIRILKKGATVPGTVLDENNRPLAEVRVMPWYGVCTQAGYMAGTDYPVHPATTDADGHFQLQHLPPELTMLTFRAEGYSPEQKTIEAASQTEPVEVHLAKGNTIRGIVADTAGKPVDGATISTGLWRDHMLLPWETKTDAEGRFSWTSAPPDEVEFLVRTSSLRKHTQSLHPSPEEQVITLPSNVQVHGLVRDADTGEPILNFKATPGSLIHGTRVFWWNGYGAVNFTDGNYLMTLDTLSSTNALRVEAEGYEPTNSRPFTADEGDVSYDFVLHKRAWPSGVVRTPDGQPATNVHVFAVTSDQALQVRNGRPGGATQLDAASIHTRTATDGSFRLSLPTGHFLLVALSDLGFTELPGDTTVFPVNITLKPWGRVEGTLLVGTNAAAGRTVRLIANDRSRNFTQPFVSATYDDAQTDDTGHFVFEHVRPGQVLIEPSYMPLHVNPGETTYANLGGTGRPVVGHILLPPNTTSTVDVSNAYAVLETRQFGERDIVQQAANEGLDEPARTERLRQWLETDAGKSYEQARRIFRLRVERDGSFRADEVPPGSYNLHIDLSETHIMQSDTPDRRVIYNVSRPVGSIERGVVIPEVPGGYTNDPLDLGQLELKPLPSQP